MEEGDFISGTPATTATILHNTTSIPYQVSTATDDVEEDDAQIFVTLLSDTAPINYVVDPAKNSATVEILDDDGTAPLAVGVYATNSYDEGQAISFTLQTTGGTNTSKTLRVNVNISQVGEFIEDSLGHRVIEIPAGQSTSSFTIRYA